MRLGIMAAGITAAGLLVAASVAPVAAQGSPDQWCAGFVDYLDTETPLNLQGEVGDLVRDGCLGYLNEAALPSSGQAAIPMDDSGASEMLVTVAAYAGTNDGPGTSCDNDNFGTMFMGLPGTQVTVTSEAGTIVGVGKLPSQGVMDDLGNCVFEAPVEITGDANFYTLDLGAKFGSMSVSRADVESEGGNVFIGFTFQ